MTRKKDGIKRALILNKGRKRSNAWDVRCPECWQPVKASDEERHICEGDAL